MHANVQWHWPAPWPTQVDHPELSHEHGRYTAFMTVQIDVCMSLLINAFSLHTFVDDTTPTRYATTQLHEFISGHTRSCMHTSREKSTIRPVMRRILHASSYHPLLISMCSPLGFDAVTSNFDKSSIINTVMQRPKKHTNIQKTYRTSSHHMLSRHAAK